MLKDKYWFTIRTNVLQDHETDEVGEFTTTRIFNESELESNRDDVKGFVFKTVGMNLASNVLTVGVPKESWFVEFSPEFQRVLNLPATVHFGGHP